MPSFEKHLVLP